VSDVLRLSCFRVYVVVYLCFPHAEGLADYILIFSYPSLRIERSPSGAAREPVGFCASYDSCVARVPVGPCASHAAREPVGLCASHAVQ
jgi:hypothetical protein